MRKLAQSCLGSRSDDLRGNFQRNLIRRGSPRGHCLPRDSVGAIVERGPRLPRAIGLLSLLCWQLRSIFRSAPNNFRVFVLGIRLNSIIRGHASACPAPQLFHHKAMRSSGSARGAGTCDSSSSRVSLPWPKTPDAHRDGSPFLPSVSSRRLNPGSPLRKPWPRADNIAAMIRPYDLRAGPHAGPHCDVRHR